MVVPLFLACSKFMMACFTQRNIDLDKIGFCGIYCFIPSIKLSLHCLQRSFAEHLGSTRHRSDVIQFVVVLGPLVFVVPFPTFNLISVLLLDRR